MVQTEMRGTRVGMELGRRMVEDNCQPHMLPYNQRYELGVQHHVLDEHTIRRSTTRAATVIERLRGCGLVFLGERYRLRSD